jgi:adenylate kinase
VYLILLGPPGTGKGTQAKLIAQRLGLLHVSSGDLFRDALAQGTDLGKQAKAYMDRGELVPDEVTIGMVEERIRETDANEGVVFDGFPRTLKQAEALDGLLQRMGKAADAALLITAADDEIVRRLSGRWLCPSCGEIYHEASRPPKQAGRCDNCGGELQQREDDRAEVVRARLQKQKPSAELLGHYRGQGKLVEIDGGQAMEAVTNDLLAAIERAGSRVAK